MSDRNYYGRIANNIQRAYYFKEQHLSDIWYYFDFRSEIKDRASFQKVWKKFCRYFRTTDIKLFGIVEHQGSSPWHFHVHSVIVPNEVLPEHGKVVNDIKRAWIDAGGVDSSFRPPKQDDPFRFYRYSLKATKPRVRGRKTKPSDKAINFHVYCNLDSLPWSGQMMPTNHIDPEKLKHQVHDYFSAKHENQPVKLRSFLWQIILHWLSIHL